jgi:predicted lipid carrier protein YhbT
MGTEQCARSPSVFAVDNVSARQQFEGPTRDIAEIAERRRDDDQLTFGGIWVLHGRPLVWLFEPAIY